MDLNREDQYGLFPRSWYYLLLSLLLILQIVETIVTVTVETKLPYKYPVSYSDRNTKTALTISKTITVELETLRLGTVAGLPRSHSGRLNVGHHPGLVLHQTLHQLALHVGLQVLLLHCREKFVSKCSRLWGEDSTHLWLVQCWGGES